MAAGAALAVAGIPLCVLPGPGVVAIAGGVALASKGQRTYSGRPATKIEQRLDAVAARVAAAVRREAAKTARSAGEAVHRSAARAWAKAGGEAPASRSPRC